MKIKKRAINISILILIVNIFLMFITWYLKESIAWFEIAYSLTVGICGSCLAALAIFITEYHAIKEDTLQDIFVKGVEIQDRIPTFKDYCKDEAEMADFLRGKQYKLPLPARMLEGCNDKEKTYNSLCGFVDQMNELSYTRVVSFWQTIQEVDFWTDIPIKKDCPYEHLNMFEKLAFRHNKSSKIRMKFAPVYWNLMEAPTLNNGYTFQIIKEFREYGIQDAAQIYGLVKYLTQKMNAADERADTGSLPLAPYLHETLWIFRDAFITEGDRQQRREARQAFMTGTEYTHIR